MGRVARLIDGFLRGAKTISAHRALPWGIFGLATFVLLVQVVGTHFTQPYTSDDIGLANIIHLWLGGQHATAWLPHDTYFLRIPLYVLFNALNIAPRISLLILYSVVTLIGFLALFLALRSFAEKWRLSPLNYLIPFLYIAALGGNFFHYQKIINGRNVELGLAFLLLVPLATSVASASRKRSRWFFLWFPLVLALFLYNDPYFLYTLFLPILVFSILVGWLAGGGHALARTAIALALGIAYYQFLHNLPANAGVINSGAGSAPTNFVAFDGLGTNLGKLGRGLFDIFNANLFGEPIRSLSTVTMLGSAAVMITTLGYSAWRIVRVLRHGSSRDEFWQLSICLVPWVAGAAYVMQPSFPGDLFRYLIIIPFVAIFILALLLHDVTNSRIRWTLYGALLVLSMLHLVEPLQALKAGDKRPNAEQEGVVATLAVEHLTKGYGDYWDANINTYLSRQRINFIQSMCGPDDKIVPMRWNLDDVVMREAAARSFIVVKKSSYFLASCQSPAKLQRQFGPPEKILRVGDGILINVYDYDIGQRFGPSDGWAK